MTPQTADNTGLIRPVLPGILLLALLLVSVVAPVSGQRSDAQPSTTGDAVDLFSDVVEVKVVNLEVVVTDRAGNLISGLEPQDFRIWVDDREQTIDYFSEVQEGQAIAASDLEGPPGVTSGRGVGTNFLVYVDDNHTFKARRDLIVRGLIDDLSRMGPNDRMAIVVQTGTDLITLTQWTNERSTLRAALEELYDASRFGGNFRSPILTSRMSAVRRARSESDVTRSRPASLSRRFGDGLPSMGEGRFLGNPADLPALSSFSDFDGFNSRSDFGFGDAYAQRMDLELAMSGALSTMRGFDVPEGRKVMLMVTGDWPLGTFPQGSSSIDTLTELDIVEPLIETANLLGYTLYPVNADSTVSIFRNQSFGQVATRTGGRMLSKRGDVLADAVADTRSYYWLGFNPSLVGNNQRHSVVIEVMRPDLTVRARNSYIDLSKDAQLAMDTQGALLFGDEAADDGVTLEFGTPVSTGFLKMEVPAIITIALDALTSLEVQGEDQIQLELRFAVVDELGAQANVPMIPIILRGDMKEGSVFEHTTNLLMRKRPHKVMVSVYDPASGQTLKSQAEIAFRP